MKTIKIAIIFILGINGLYSLVNWLGSDSTPNTQLSIQESYQQPAQAADGFDLAALTALSKEIRSGQELERRLNEPKGINNLDLDDNKKVDYLQVEEFGDPNSGKIGYSVFTEPAKNQRQEVAEVLVEQNGDKAEIQVTGSPQIYGDNAIFNDFAPIERTTPPPASTQAQANPYPVYPSYFMPRPLWMSPFGFGYYPPFFGFFPLIGPSMYMNRMGGYHTTVSSGPNRHQQSSTKKISNPNQGKSASTGIKRSLKKPTATQKQFSAKSRSRQVGKGGFGRQNSGVKSTPRSPARQVGQAKPSSSFGQRNTGSFGNRAGSSFGQQRARSSSSFRGFGGGSRSFSFGGK